MIVKKWLVFVLIIYYCIYPRQKMRVSSSSVINMLLLLLLLLLLLFFGHILTHSFPCFTKNTYPFYSFAFNPLLYSIQPFPYSFSILPFLHHVHQVVVCPKVLFYQYDGRRPAKLVKLLAEASPSVSRFLWPLSCK